MLSLAIDLLKNLRLAMATKSSKILGSLKTY